jgi:hypothetical protein
VGATEEGQQCTEEVVGGIGRTGAEAQAVYRDDRCELLRTLIKGEAVEGVGVGQLDARGKMSGVEGEEGSHCSRGML